MSIPATEPVLSIRDLHVEFTPPGGSPVQAVKGVSFDLHPQEVLAVVGESGSGKSVTAMSVLGLLPATSRTTGSIRLGDQELVGADRHIFTAVRGKRVAMIFQDPFGTLDPVFTIGYQLREMLKQHFPQMSRSERQARAVELLRLVEMPDPEYRAKSYPHQLSGGQAQRVVIAMALACDPEVLIADEPTTALDVTVQREILDVILRLRGELGFSVLIITHDMGVVADVAERVVVMHRGRVEETREVSELFRSPQADYTRQLLAAVPRLNAQSRDSGADAEARPVLEVQDLTVEYRRGLSRFIAVDGVSLSIAPGEVLALVGESGSGKSTIGKSVIGLAPVQSGSVIVDGTDAVSSPRRQVRELRKRIGVVFQNPMGALDPRLTIDDAVGEPLRVHAGLRGETLRQRVEKLLDAVELPGSWAQRYPHELSGGQRQRVSIARAVALDPVLLIADEPTSALDVSVQATVLDLFRRVQAELNFACLFISHDLAVVDELADRVAVMRRGELVEEGVREAVLADPQHEYTQKLLESAPVPDPDTQRERRRARLAAV